MILYLKVLFVGNLYLDGKIFLLFMLFSSRKRITVLASGRLFVLYEEKYFIV